MGPYHSPLPRELYHSVLFLLRRVPHRRGSRVSKSRRGKDLPQNRNIYNLVLTSRSSIWYTYPCRKVRPDSGRGVFVFTDVKSRLLPRIFQKAIALLTSATGTRQKPKSRSLTPQKARGFGMTGLERCAVWRSGGLDRCAVWTAAPRSRMSTQPKLIVDPGVPGWLLECGSLLPLFFPSLNASY